MSQKATTAGVGVLSKALRILEYVQASDSGLSIHEVVQKTGITRSTAYRLLSYLEREGYVTRTDRGAYKIGMKLVRLALGADGQSALQQVARPVLRKLQETTGETVNLAVFDGDKVLYTEVIESAHEFRLVSKVGLRRPIHSTSLGKALVAFLHPEARDDLLDVMSFQPLTPHTIANRTQFEIELETVRRQGYALDNEETLLGARCVGAPILNSRKEPIAAVSIAGPITRVSEDKIPSLVAAVKQAALEVSNYLGASDEGRAPAPHDRRLAGSPPVRKAHAP
jgi:DNA-binding IclR family transcriptional regulator